MKRLTHEDGFEWYRTRNQNREIYERLKYYEDMEEQGKLKILPCAEGDTVYKIATQRDNFDDSEYPVLMQLSFRIELLNRIGRDIFLTEEEAANELIK